MKYTTAIMLLGLAVTTGTSYAETRGDSHGPVAIASAEVKGDLDFYVSGWANDLGPKVRENTAIYDFVVINKSATPLEENKWGFGVLEGTNIKLENGNLYVTRSGKNITNAPSDEILVVKPIWDSNDFSSQNGSTPTLVEYVGKKQLTGQSSRVMYQAAKYHQTIVAGNYPISVQAYAYNP